MSARRLWIALSAIAVMFALTGCPSGGNNNGDTGTEDAATDTAGGEDTSGGDTSGGGDTTGGEDTSGGGDTSGGDDTSGGGDAGGDSGSTDGG